MAEKLAAMMAGVPEKKKAQIEAENLKKLSDQREYHREWRRKRKLAAIERADKETI